MNMSAGSAITRQSGTTLYQIMTTAIMPTVMRKSTKLVMTELAGMTRRGKYTFEIRWALPIRLELASLSPVANNCHGNMPTRTSRKYGAPDGAGRRATLLNTSVSTTVVKNGLMKAHATPIAVCL